MTVARNLDLTCPSRSIYSRLGPQRQNGQRDPVLVWIHGGSFHSGGTSDLDAGIRSFVGERVIVVSLQYRLGMLGWLKWGTRGFAGNQGLTDVIEALSASCCFAWLAPVRCADLPCFCQR